MIIRQQTTIRTSTTSERQAQTIESIRELEAMFERGDIEAHAYFTKKRALIRML